MHYYQFHIGDYRAATAHLSNDEDLAYRRLLDYYYDTEAPIPNPNPTLCKRLRLGFEVIETVLNDMFEHTDRGWVHPRCDAEIEAFKSKIEIARANGKRGGRRKKTRPLAPANQTLTQPLANHKPLTINHIVGDRQKTDDPPTPVLNKPAKPKIEKKEKRGERLPKDWQPSAELLAACKAKRPDLNLEATAEVFRDYWVSVPGAKGLKLDWDATFRVWVSKQHAGKGTVGGSVINKPSATRFEWLETADVAYDRITGEQYNLKSPTGWTFDPKGYYGAAGIVSKEGLPPIAATTLLK